MPFRLGVPELIIILVIILVVFGVGKLPQIGGALGRSIKEFRKEAGGKGEPLPEETKAKVSKNSSKPPEAHK